MINHYKLPAIFHTGHSGMGTGMRGGGGVRLKYGQPILVDDVAVDFPDMKIILAHPSWPWTDESLSMALHKENVFIDLSGWSPKYFPPQVITYANSQLRKKMLFGSDFPLIKPGQVDGRRRPGRLPRRGHARHPQRQRRTGARVWLAPRCRCPLDDDRAQRPIFILEISKVRIQEQGKNSHDEADRDTIRAS